MALITCPECGRRITDLEDRCFGCGLSMEKIKIIQFKNLVGEKKIKCMICDTEFELSDGCCPKCKYPAFSVTDKPLSYDHIESYRQTIGINSTDSDSDESTADEISDIPASAGNNEEEEHVSAKRSYYTDSFLSLEDFEIIKSRDGGISILSVDTVRLDGFDGEDEWLILAKENNYWLLLSKYCQSSGPVSNTSDYSWETSHVRQYLNTEFLEKFTEKQRNLIVPGNETGNKLSQLSDLVFLLSKEEYSEYHNIINAWRYAWKNPRIKLEWALRTGGGLLINVVNNYGGISNARVKTIYLGTMTFGYRPAIWIDISKLEQHREEEKANEDSKVQILSIMDRQGNVYVALCRDPINLILCDLRGDKELYSLFSSSDEILFLEGELGIGRFEWSESDNKLVYYKYYIVHNRMDRVEIFFDDRASYKILETQVNTGEDTGLARDFVFL